jgi:hypothetical protein
MNTIKIINKINKINNKYTISKIKKILIHNLTTMIKEKIH